MPVHPCLLGEAVGGKLARRQHHRDFFAADLIAVEIDVDERVLGPERLLLIEDLLERTVVPEPHGRRIGERAASLAGRGRVADVERAFVDSVERIGRARGLDIPRDVGALLVQLIGLHDEVLDQRGIHATDDEARGEPEDDRGAEDPERPAERIREARERRDSDDDGEDRERREARVDAGVAGANEHALRPEQKLELVEKVAARDEGEEEPAQDREVRARRSREGERGPPRDADIGARERTGRDPDDASHEVQGDDADGDDDERDEKPAAHELEHWQREEVEADVAPEDWISRAERDLIDPAQQHVPLVTSRESEEERGDEQEPHEPKGHRQRPSPAALGVDHDPRHLRPECEVHVRQGEDEEDRSEHRECVEPRGKTPQVDRLEAEATEPEEVGEETD